MAARLVKVPMAARLNRTRCRRRVTVQSLAHTGDTDDLDYIEKLLESIVPGLPVFESDLSNAERLARAVEANVRWTVNRILNSPEGQARLAEGRMRIVGAIYDIHSGHVRWLPES